MIELSPVKCDFIIIYTSIDGGLSRGTNRENLHSKKKKIFDSPSGNNSDNDYTS